MQMSIHPSVHLQPNLLLCIYSGWRLLNRWTPVAAGCLCLLIFELFFSALTTALLVACPVCHGIVQQNKESSKASHHYHFRDCKYTSPRENRELKTKGEKKTKNKLQSWKSKWCSMLGGRFVNICSLACTWIHYYQRDFQQSAAHN